MLRPLSSLFFLPDRWGSFNGLFRRRTVCVGASKVGRREAPQDLGGEAACSLQARGQQSDGAPDTPPHNFRTS